MIAEIKLLSPYRHHQKTLQNAIHCVGIGLHSGKKVCLSLKPAPVGTGVVFRRVDVTDKNNEIPALYNYVSDTRLNSCISNEDGVSVSTIEHLMAALSGFGITNVFVDVDAPEVPVMDGSAEDYVTLIQCAGIVPQNAPQKAIKILKEVSFEDDKGISVTLSPAETGMSIDFMIDFPTSKVIGRQEYSIVLSERTFKDSVAYARTFGFAQEVEMLQSMGLAKGGSLENAVVVDKDRVLNKEGLRSENEFVVHKTLDAIGDLYQLGMPIIGRFSGVKSGHAHTNQLLRRLMADKTAYQVVDLDTYEESLLSLKYKTA